MDFNNYRRYLILTVLLITIILLSTAVAGKGVGCVIQQIYTPDGENLLEEKMVCRDGNIGPTYWELFAEFYYGNADNIPEYCRKVKRKGQAFYIPKKICLDKTGQWSYND